ncbi:alpha/beta hydrolase [Chitinophaga niabensis]|uniref:Enterochelin esterase n=1 Tax=Chitinophaga niabensis TaxID=536979 RepID=A0A1N6DE91_9BACT|nr:alpha/beta fold hydrolase [Chitinophaga niabensis]SIN68983.1 Enterochelin esterase [Chitinophaga niabensis]
MKYLILFAWTCFYSMHAQAQKDLRHNSHVFGHDKLYRLYLPDDYAKNDQRYPVVYFFHGWGGRHFKDDNAKLDYTALQQVVNKYRVIMVMWDGNIDESEPRPYNIGNHEDVKFQVQMKDYFPELVSHIDSTYRTLTGRENRGIIGFSMGGIMAYYLGGRYPDKVSSIVSMTGSPEFFFGYPDNHTLYPVRYTFGNLQSVRVRMHTSPTDILYGLNEEVRAGAAWEGLPLDYQSLDGGHMVDRPGETRVFESALRFVTEGFKNTLPAPLRWSHYDLYPEFDVWGYKVESNLHEPGYLYFKHIDKSGWGFHTRRWLPLGAPIPGVEAKMITAPVYQPGQQYQVVQFDLRTYKLHQQQLLADSGGRLAIMQKSGTETGIYREGDPSAWIGLNHNLQFLKNGQNELLLQLFNRGGENDRIEELDIRIRTKDEAVVVSDSVVKIKAQPHERLLQVPPVRIISRKQPTLNGKPFEVKLILQITAGNQVSEDEMIIPAWFDVPEWTDIRIDGDAEKGMQLYKDSSRLRLHTEDLWVASEEERLVDEVLPARWPDGFTLSSVIKIKPGCPKGHVITFLASYETKTFNPIERKVRWGLVRIKI